MHTKIADIMTRDVQTVRSQDNLQLAAQRMDELNVGVLPVCDDNILMGVITDRDITVRATSAGLLPSLTPVADVMTQQARYCRPFQTVADVVQKMSDVQIRRLPVLDDQDRLIGIVSLGDLVTRGGEEDGVDGTLRRISTPSEPDRSGQVT
ncbi:MAG: CBS domain-containing protein [Pseudomonadota bacterium]